MKKFLQFSLFLIALSFSLSACMDETYDRPVYVAPKYSGSRTFTIKQLKALCTSSLVKIDTNAVICGVVVANDESGNIYKAIEIQDETGGIEISLDQTSLYNTYPVGQRIYIECKGMYLGTYGGVVKLGDTYNNAIGRMSAVKISKHFFADGAPSTANLPAIREISSTSQLNDSMLNTLVTLKNVSFADAGKVFAEYQTTTERDINFADATSLVAYNSGYAKFQASLLPSGSGNVTGVLSKFKSTWQILIRSWSDLEGFQVIPIVGDGSKTNPYVITDAKQKQGETGKWIKGYIVGVFETVDTKYDVANFGPTFTIQSNILIAASATETDVTKCIPVKLPSGTVRTALNLNANITNLGKEVLVYGDLASGFGIPAIINTSAYWWVDSNTGIEPAPTSKYTLETSINSGTYIFAANISGTYKVFTPLEASKTYGFFAGTDATMTNNSISTLSSNEFTVTASTNGFTIQDAIGRYLYMTGSYNSFNVSATMPTSGAEWTFTKNNDGTFIIKNVSMNKSIQYSKQYSSYGSYSTSTDVMPFVFKKN